MIKLLACCLVLLASAAFAATPIENAVAIAAQLGAPISAPPAAAIDSPAARPAAASAKAVVVAAPTAKLSLLTGSSGSISGDAAASGSGPINCVGGRMSAWINLRADVSVTTDDGAAAQFPVRGTVFLSGSCQRGAGFASGSAQLNGSGPLIKAGRSVGTASLSGSAFINQYVTGSFIWVNQNVSLSGSYSETAAAAK
jgi:hypothetical protein